MKNKHLLLFFITLLFPLFAQSQHTENRNTLAEEKIYVEAASASVLQWFNRIAEEKGIILSYNASEIDLHKRCRISKSGEMSIETLLKEILKEYKVQLTVILPRKLVIQTSRPASYAISGTITEKDSGERLYGSLILAEGDNGRFYISSDDNGLFRLSLPEGNYTLTVSYIGYNTLRKQIHVGQNLSLNLQLHPLLFEIEEITVKKQKPIEELSELTPSNQLSFNCNDLFSQIWILPGVAGTPTGADFQVDGGGYDENQILLDGVPLYHSGHINSLFPLFNGDAVKGIYFYKGFFPARFEGRLSSVTDIRLKEGNKQEHVRTATIDMPAASIVMEGPIIKNKLSYIVGARRSWLDFFDNLFSVEDRLNHATYDYNAKISYSLSSTSSIEAMAYGAWDDYHWPMDQNRDDISILRWENQIYQLRYNTLIGQVSNTSSVSYSSHTNRAYAELLGLEQEGYIRRGIRSANAVTEFGYNPNNIYNIHWGLKYSYEKYDLSAWEDNTHIQHEPINQFSVFFDNQIRLSHNLYTQVGAHFVSYNPKNHQSYNSIQPRFSIRYSPSDNDLLYVKFSKMEQFYHYLKLGSLALPTDFRMPSIEGYKPRSSEHYEIRWKHFLGNGVADLSVYYKTRRNLLALRPETMMENADGLWKNYIMAGNGDSYGTQFYFYYNWKHFMLQCSYTYSRSREWFKDVEERGKLPSLYDIPHQMNVALSYKVNSRSSVSIGGSLRSGKVTDTDTGFDPVSVKEFRASREAMNYRIDAGYTYRKDFGKYLLLLRAGLYNIVGNPTDEDVLNFYSIHFNNNCLPYGSVSFKF